MAAGSILAEGQRLAWGGPWDKLPGTMGAAKGEPEPGRALALCSMLNACLGPVCGCSVTAGGTPRVEAPRPWRRRLRVSGTGTEIETGSASESGQNEQTGNNEPKTGEKVHAS